MSLDDRTAQAHLSPDERRELLRAFADRMLLKISAMDDPADLPGVERAVRVAAVIERLYSRCDRAERHAPDPGKLEADRAVNKTAAIKARVNLANTLKWGEDRRQDLGQWWEAAQNATQNASRKATNAVTQDQTSVPAVSVKSTETPVVEAAVAPKCPAPDLGMTVDTPSGAVTNTAKVTYVDYTDRILEACAELALQRREAAKSAQIPGPPLRGPPSRSG